MIDHVSQGKWVIDDHAEKFLCEMVADGEIVVLERAPTVSQAAFIGLQYTQGYYNKMPALTPGTVEHHWFRWATKTDTRPCAGTPQ
jgi:hypothetical protein